MADLPPPQDVEAFLSAQPDDVRAALLHLRAMIRAAAPDATEQLNYGVPAFKLRGRPFVSYGAGRDHCSFYVQSPAVMEAHAEQLMGYRTSKGTVQFTPANPLPDDLVKTLVRARADEITS